MHSNTSATQCLDLSPSIIIYPWIHSSCNPQHALSPALVVARRINGFSDLNLTKLDVLSDLDIIKLGVGYKGPDGKLLPSMPANITDLEAVEVVYEEHPGWKEDISGARSWDDLPTNAKKYIKCVLISL